MKANKFFLGLALIGAILTGCEKDPVQTGDYDSKSYMSVSIAQASGTRAGTDGGFLEGTVDENQITSIDFYFYKADGTAFTFGGGAENGAGNAFASNVYTYTVKTSDITDKTGNIDEVVNAVLVIQHNKGNIPTAMIAVINGSAEYSGQPLTDVKTALITNPINGTKGHIMTNSVYVGADGSIVMETPISIDNLAINADNAKLHPVKIYVERTAARVEFKEKAAVANLVYPTGTTITDSKGNSTTIYAKIVGWDIVTTAKNTTLAKKIKDIATWGASINGMEWNKPALYRSYWADAEHDPTNLTKTFTWKGIKEANLVNTGVDYCLENTTLPEYKTQMTDGGTTIEDEDMSRTNVTKVVVAAELYSDLAATTKVEIANWYGQYYTLANLKEVVAQSLKDKLIHNPGGSVYNPITAAQIDIAQFNESEQNSYEVYFKLAATAPKTGWFKINASNEYEAVGGETEVNVVLKNVENAKVWNGMSYYIVNIEHLGTTKQDASNVYQPAYYGVVRNHAYEIKFNGVSGPGTPVYDPEVVIPEPVTEEETESFVAAEINVLSWHLVTQEVTLQ